MAKDQVTRQSWWEDQIFLSRASILQGDKVDRNSFANSSGDCYFKEATLYYSRPPDGAAFFHRAVKVKGIPQYSIR
jgi:hypothetical protein